MALLPLVMLAAGCEEKEELLPSEERTVLTVGLPDSKTYLGASEDGKRKVYWANGDRIAANGVASDPLEGIPADALSAEFSFPGVLNLPYNILYPASAYADASHVTLPASQAYVAGGYDPAAALLAGQMTSAGGSLEMSHLSALIRIAVKSAGSTPVTLASVIFQGKDDEQVSGSFTIDYATPALNGASSAEADRSITMTVNQALSSSEALELFLAVPAGLYSNGFRFILTDSEGHPMQKSKSTSTTLTAGKLAKLPEFVFEPMTSTEFTLPDVEEEVLVPDAYNVTGRVVDTEGHGLENVVVTDGEQCVRTLFDGSFYLNTDPATTKFIYISTPSGYLPPVSGGLPQFYKLLSGITPSNGLYNCGNFTLTPVDNPDRYTLLISADPQPRKKEGKWALMDGIAFNSLAVCEDLYLELKDVAATISDRQVYGICLGDIVHEDMSLFPTYINGISGVGYPTYNVIGNHDYNPDAADDEAGDDEFESYFGPCSYSFNIGKIHYIILDDLLMEKNPDADNKLTKSGHGLSERIWAWLQADLSYIPKTTKLMVCAHAPMFRLENGNERTNTQAHGRDYGALFALYPEVHAWAGDSHTGFNYIYPSSHRNKKVQVHTVARSTGELWTNEYLTNGTPYGFTVVEVDGNDISWRFHPNKYQRAAWIGSPRTSSAPSYTWRDWNYNASGIAVMKDGSGTLSESYQMHAYPKGSYGDDYVYVNVFLWDTLWQNPVFTPSGGGTPLEMVCVHSSANPRDYSVLDSVKVHDLAMTEIRAHYKANNQTLHGYSGYSSGVFGQITTLFRVAPPAGCTGGTVSVTDRFGNTYTRPVSW